MLSHWITGFLLFFFCSSDLVRAVSSCSDVTMAVKSHSKTVVKIRLSTVFNEFMEGRYPPQICGSGKEFYYLHHIANKISLRDPTEFQKDLEGSRFPKSIFC